MEAPRVCPQCGTESIEPTFQYATLSVSFDQMQCNISGLNAYRCDNAHYFIVIGGSEKLEKSDANREGSSFFS